MRSSNDRSVVDRILRRLLLGVDKTGPELDLARQLGRWYARRVSCGVNLAWSTTPRFQRRCRVCENRADPDCRAPDRRSDICCSRCTRENFDTRRFAYGRSELITGPASQKALPAARCLVHLPRLLFLRVSLIEMRSLLSVKRATQCLDVTRPRPARRRGFGRFWLGAGIGFDVISRQHGYGSFAIHR